jgi:hypothetical protein
MKKFSRGGAQGMYDRRMADIEKDYQNAMKRKTGRAAEVAEAKRQQRIADAKDDFAKRTGADRTATRVAERTAESNLTKTRKYGAPKSVTKDELIAPGKMTESLSVPKMDSSIGAKPAAKAVPKPVPKPVQKPVAAKPARMGDQGFAYKKKDMPTTGKGVSTHYRYVRGGSNSGAAADGTAAKRLENKGLKTGDLETGNKGTSSAKADTGPRDNTAAGRRQRMGAALSYLNPFSYISDETSARYRGFGNISVGPREARQTSSSNNAATEATRAAKLATLKKAAEAPGATGFDKDRYKRAVSSGMYAKGGKIKKMAKGGSTPPQPTAADRARSKAQMDSLKKVKPTPAEIRALQSANRSEGRRYAAGGVTKEMPSSKAMGSLGMAKGGKAKMKPAAKGKAKGNPFAATKFGAAMMKKGADAKGRAMPKFAKGGSIDGCAVKGKTKMAMGGMTGYKKGGKTC